LAQYPDVFIPAGTIALLSFRSQRRISQVCPEYKLSLYRLGTNLGKAWNKQKRRTGQSTSRLQAEGRRREKCRNEFPGLSRDRQHDTERELQMGKSFFTG
jgi:hypothetical protein